MLSAEFFDKTYNDDRHRPGRLIESNPKTFKVKNTYNGGTGGGDVGIVGHNTNSYRSNDLPKNRSPRSSKKTLHKSQRVVVSSSPPFHCGGVPTSTYPISSAAKKAAPKGLTDLAINVSNAYRHECSSSSSPSSTSKKTLASNTRNNNNRPDSERRSRGRTKHDKRRATATAALHSSRTNSANDNNYRMMYVNSDSLDPNMGQKNVGIGIGVRDTGTATPSSQDRQRSETYNNITNTNYQSLANHLPKGVDHDSTTRGKELVRRNKNKKIDKIMGRFTIQDQIQLQDLYDEETRKNRDLSNIVSQLEDEISTLQVSLETNVYNNGTRRQNDKRRNSSDASNNIVQKSSLGGSDNDNVNDDDPSLPKRSEDYEVTTANNDASRNLRQANIELEETKQVIQMLFQDLKISKQNESESRNKLKSSRLTLQKNQLRYEENMRIAMKSADDVRANLKKLEQERSRKKAKSSAEVARITNELLEVRNECIRLNQQLEQQAHNNNVVEATRQTQEGIEEEAVDGRSEHPADLEKVTAGKIHSSALHYISLTRDDDDRIQSSANRANQEEIASKQTKNLKELMANENNECPSSQQIITQQLSIVKTSLLNTNAIDIPRPQQQSIDFIPNTSFVREETEALSSTIPKSQNVDPPVPQNTRGSSYNPTSKNLCSSSSSSNSFTRENDEGSNVSKRSLDFASCMEDSDDVAKYSAGVTNFILSKNTLSDSNAAHRSNKSTLNELMKELEASKKRLEKADKKLKGLVNKKGLLNTVRNSDDARVNKEGLLRTVQNSDDSQHDIGSIDIVDSLDDSIEVSHRSYAYV
jgi:hypothetical protein